MILSPVNILLAAVGVVCLLLGIYRTFSAESQAQVWRGLGAIVLGIGASSIWVYPIEIAAKLFAGGLVLFLITVLLAWSSTPSPGSSEQPGQLNEQNKTGPFENGDL